MKKKNRFRRWPLILAVVALTAGMTACGSEKSTLPDLSFMGETSAISREEGSGTRAEFEALLKLPEDIAKSQLPLIAAVRPLEESVAYTSISAFGFSFS